jgi:hypothetical protein
VAPVGDCLANNTNLPNENPNMGFKKKTKLK